MAKNLVIVESPAKAKTIEKFLGKDFRIMSSFGHIRDLSDEKGMGIDFEQHYKPLYTVPPEKKKVVSELRKASKQAEIIWLASDEDREGEAIAWHLFDELRLNKNSIHRIVFHEITKDAILHAVANPRNIDLNLVDAQQARRVLDRIVGFELSPILWRKIRPGLSAGRVQSIAVRLIVEREREIQAFKAEINYRVSALFSSVDAKGNPVELKTELSQRFATKQEAYDFLETCKDAQFEVADIVKKPAKKTPAPPFTTSTLQQEAARKLGFSVSQTMRVAQNLYESGRITYMRTDSVNLSELALNTSKAEIKSMAGDRYVKTRRFSTKSKGAQEAHEAIRPTYMTNHSTDGALQEKRLYELIWKRTIASQMADAELEKTTIHINISNSPYQFIASGEVIIFDGFLKVYLESTDEEPEDENSTTLPMMKKGESMDAKEILAQQRFSQRPPRYTEASLVRKLEELGIGRPSTYAPTISTIQNRKYVEKGDRPAEKRAYNLLQLQDGTITDQEKTENTGAEKAKLFPTDIGFVVNDFLTGNFPAVLDYNFTAQVEKEFDHIADGDMTWNTAIDNFYKQFHPIVEDTLKNAERKIGERVLGVDPKSGRKLSVKIGRYGPIAQIGERDEAQKPQYSSLRHNQSIESITLEEALELFKLPRELGDYETAPVTVAVGRFGPYLRHNALFYSIPKEEDPLGVSLNRAIEIIEKKREEERNRIINIFGDIRILNGRYGPYISFKKKNYKIPKTLDPRDITEEIAKDLIRTQDNAPDKKKTAPKKTAATKETAQEPTQTQDSAPNKKKTTPKKTAPKKATVKKAKKE
ncbi:MAG: type I DNA topoisomerase [Prevotellaceae bacterium]|jgi:DNA topoisomerase-1|nr:type I DNA topoisomerase [Prevotellaceae bacterium]